MEKKADKKRSEWIFIVIVLVICLAIYVLYQSRQNQAFYPAEQAETEAEQPVGALPDTVVSKLQKQGFTLTPQTEKNVYLLSTEETPSDQAALIFSLREGRVTAFTLELPQQGSDTAVGEALQQAFLRRSLPACLEAMDPALTYADRMAMYDTALETREKNKDLTYQAEQGVFTSRLLSDGSGTQICSYTLNG